MFLIQYFTINSFQRHFKNGYEKLVAPLLPSATFLHPLKTSEYEWFSHVF